MATNPLAKSKTASWEGASKGLSGPEEAELRRNHPNNLTIKWLDENHIPITRQNYIDAGAPEGEWTAEHEDSLPRELKGLD